MERTPSDLLKASHSRRPHADYRIQTNRILSDRHLLQCAGTEVGKQIETHGDNVASASGVKSERFHRDVDWILEGEGN